MANTLYDNARKLFLEGGLDWLSDDFRVVLVDTGVYAPNFSSNVYLTAIDSGAARISTSGVLTGKTTDGGAADANPVTFTSVTGASVEAIVIYKDTGVDATSPLIAYIDTATGLPITPNGGDIIVTWDDGVNKIFRL